MRTVLEITENPIPGDAVDVLEERDIGNEDDREHEVETLLRVIAVAEDHVWLKEYGIGGRMTYSIRRWRERLNDAKRVTVVRAGLPDAATNAD